MVYATDQSKAPVLVCFLFCVPWRFLPWGLSCCHVSLFFLMFFQSGLALWSSCLGKRELVYICFSCICLFILQASGLSLEFLDIEGEVLVIMIHFPISSIHLNFSLSTKHSEVSQFSMSISPKLPPWLSPDALLFCLFHFFLVSVVGCRLWHSLDFPFNFLLILKPINFKQSI